MLTLRQFYSKYVISMVLSLVATTLYALWGFSIQTIKNLFHGYGDGDVFMMVLLSTLIFFFSLISIFSIFIIRANVVKRVGLKLTAFFVSTLLLTMSLAGVVWANLGAVIGIMAVLISILLSPKLAYLFSLKKIG